MSNSQSFSPPLLQSKNFLKLALLGLGLSILGALSFQALTIFYISSESFKAAISIVAISYSILLLYQTHVKTGKVSLLLFYVASQLVLLFWIAPLDLVLLTNLFMIWFVRCAYLHRNFIGSILDSILLALGLAASVWSLNQGSSLLLSFWCFFLVQALVVYLPHLTQIITGNKQDLVNASAHKLGSNSVESRNNHSSFDEAYRKARALISEVQQSNS